MEDKIIPIRSKNKHMVEKEWLTLLDQLEEVRQLSTENPASCTAKHALTECGEIIKQIRYKDLYDDIVLLLQHLQSRVTRYPEQYPVDYTVRLFAAEVAHKAGYKDRTDWTSKLKKNPESMYATRIRENRFHI